jgi:hypothetical protein
MASNAPGPRRCRVMPLTLDADDHGRAVKASQDVDACVTTGSAMP